MIQHLLVTASLTIILSACAASIGISTPIAPSASTVPTTTLASNSFQTRADPKGIEQVQVPAGSFLMGTSVEAAQNVSGLKPPSWVSTELPSEQPQHPVTLTSGYWIDKYEVTNAAYKAFADEGGYQKQEYWSEAGWKWLSGRPGRSACSDKSATDKPNLPCVQVTWYEAEAYAHWRGGRLPTEAEWEFAARGPQAFIYPWGNKFDASKANVVNSTGLMPVGSYPAGVSWIGAHDMAGNAMEWVQDWLDVKYYQSIVQADPPGPKTGSIKIEKGGWWGSNEFVARSAYRHYEDPPTYSDGHIGFRIVTPINAPASSSIAPTAIPIASEIISFKTADGLTLAGTLYGSGSNLVILSNVGDGTQPDWQELPDELTRHGYLVLTYDWRGLGLSAGKRDYLQSPLDLKAAIAFARSRGATKIILAGASLGGMASIKNAAIKELAGVIVISSPRQAPDFVIDVKEIAAMSVPKLFIGSQQDTTVLYAETAALHQIAVEPKLLKSYAGSAHGTDILKTSDRADFVKTIIDFITTTLPNP